LVLAECCPKHLKFTSQVLCFWYSTDSGGMPFQTFHVFNVFHSVALAPHWTHLSIYMLVLPKKRLGSVSVGILQKIYEWKLCFEYLGDLFPKDLLVWICSGDVLQQVSSRNIFGICQHIFYETFWETFQKKWKHNGSREMLQKSNRVLMKYCYEMSSRRCFVANIWNNIYTCPKYVWGI